MGEVKTHLRDQDMVRYYDMNNLPQVPFGACGKNKGNFTSDISKVTCLLCVRTKAGRRLINERGVIVDEICGECGQVKPPKPSAAEQIADYIGYRSVLISEDFIQNLIEQGVILPGPQFDDEEFVDTGKFVNVRMDGMPLFPWGSEAFAQRVANANAGINKKNYKHIAVPLYIKVPKE